VVHAGLELLRDQVQLHIVDEAGKTIMELMDDIAASSTTAISILDDLLNYENIDAGGNEITVMLQNLALHSFIILHRVL
jgi:hypothetical protein